MEQEQSLALWPQTSGGNYGVYCVLLAELGQMMLASLGEHVTARTDSAEARARFQNQPDPFDVVITDHAMPGLLVRKVFDEGEGADGE